MDDIIRWITKNGKRIPIKMKQINKLLTEEERQLVYQKIYEKAEPLNSKEYDKLCNDFETSLTEEEKKVIKFYGIGGGASSSLNSPKTAENWELTYRFSDENNKNGYIEKKLKYKDAIETPLDKKATFIVSEDKNHDENIKWNYEMTERDQKQLKDMDNIFDKKGITLDKDIIVYRRGYENAEDILNGYVRLGYTSTSAWSRINKKTPGGLILGENEFEILVPKGTKILPIKNLVDDDIKKQREILLPRNIRYDMIQNKSTSGDWIMNKNGHMRWIEPKKKYYVRLKSLSEIEQYYIDQGYSKATALKKAKQDIAKRKKN